MSHDRTRQLRDIVLGEAVIALFVAQRPLNNESLIRQLMQMAEEETDNDKRRACLEGVREVRKNGAQLALGKEKQGSDNTLH